jgi:hypothetical protein
MIKFYKKQNYRYIPLSRDAKKKAYVFLSIFLHLMGGYRRKQAYSYIHWNNRENKHIGNCGKICIEMVFFIIIIRQ